jgi:hypothetical protein
MNKIILKSKNLNWILSALIVFGLASCKKENSTGYTPGTGAPTITAVHTLSKTLTDTTDQTITTYDTSGNITTKVNQLTGKVVGFDSLTTSGNKQDYYVIYGTNLGTTTKITFNGVEAYFNRALSSDKSLVVSIPTTVPTVGTTATNKLVVTTLHGSVTYSFTTLTPVPTIQTVSDYDFWAGSQVTLNGFGFATVKSVGIVGSTATAAIVSQTDNALTIQFPATAIAVNRTNLVITYVYNSAGNTKSVTTIQEFNDLDNAYVIFNKSNFQNTWFDNSWQHPSGVSNGAVHESGGSASIQAHYPAGNWAVEGWAGWNSPTGGIVYDPAYKYLTFWVKGGAATHTLVLVGDKMVGGYGQVQNANAYTAQLITVPAGVWTYFKIPLTAPSTPFSKASTLLNYWANGTTAQQLGFFLQGGLNPSVADVDEDIYFDEVAFLK